MGVIEGILRLTLGTIHAMVWLRDGLYFSLVWLWAGLMHAAKHKGSKLECIQEDTRNLKKIPLHLALIIHEEQLSHNDLANVVMWAFAAGIHNVSIYASQGASSAVDQLPELRKALSTRHQQMFSPPFPVLEVYTSEQVVLTQDHCHSEISREQSKLHSVLVLTPQDGKCNIVAAARDICQSVKQKKLKTNEIDTAMVNKNISAMRGFPNPELALVFGNVHSTLGFPPWQMRLTEILFLGSHHKLAYRDFLSSLQRYSNCQQRFGK